MKMARQICIYLLIWLSIICISLPFYKNEYLVYRTNKYCATTFSTQQLQKNKKVYQHQEAMNTLTPPSVNDVMKSAFKDYSASIIGSITIPSVKLRLPILNNLTNENLYVGATPVVQNRQIGTNNFVLAGHHIRKENAFFGPLLQIKKGADIYLYDANYTYQYRVNDRFLTMEKDLSVLNASKSPTLTLITCDKPTETNKREIVKAKLVKKIAHTKEKSFHFSTQNRSLLPFLIVAESLLFFGGFLFLFIRKRRKSKGEGLS